MLERIEITPFVVIAGDILQNRRTGTLTVVKPPLRKVLYWAQGELVLILSQAPEESLGDFLVRRGVMDSAKALEIMSDEPSRVVAKFHESGGLELSWRQTLLREWLAAQFLPLFSLDEGTAAFTEERALDPQNRVFLQSTAALLVEGVRSVSNGLLLRRSLGELKREIGMARNTRFSLDTIPLTDPERQIASSLKEPQSIEAFLKRFSNDSVTAAKVVIAMLALGIFAVVEAQQASAQTPAANFDDMQRDLELLAAIGANDVRSLRAVAFSRQLSGLDHYQVLEVARAASRSVIITQAEEKKRQYDPTAYPPIVRDSLQVILRRIDEAAGILRDPARRAAYDKLLQDRASGGGGGDVQQRLQQRMIAEQNLNRAKDLSVQGDYYGAIVLLKQAVEFTPDNAQAWYLLGSCQQQNPKWRRDAAESFQMALSSDPNFVDAMISLGDVYKSEGLVARAQSCWEDVLKIAPENQQARSRLEGVRKR